MRKIHLLAAALAVSAAPAVLAAQGDAPKAAASKAAPAPGKAAPKAITAEQQASVKRAATILRAFNLAFESKDVQQPVKGALLVCLYNNKLSDITAATSRALAASPAGTEPDATSVYRAAAGVCGVTFKQNEGAAPAGAPPKAAPSKSGDSR